MTPQTSPLRLALAVFLVTAAVGRAGDFADQTAIHDNLFTTSPPCPVKQFPRLESVAAVPLELLEETEIPFNLYFCQINVTREGKGVKKAKGTFDASLLALISPPGRPEEFVDTNILFERFVTDKNGRADFASEFPFLALSEAGGVAAARTQVEFTNKKKADTVTVRCGVTASNRPGPDR